MISIIISTKNQAMLEAVSQSIANTVGAPFEIISVSNSDGKMALSLAYNSGAATANFELLCFLHEDILFKSTNWGVELINVLMDDSIGLVGVAGGILKTRTPGPAWYSHLANSTRMNIIQHYKDGIVKHELINPNADINYSEVVVIDGVFMACRRSVWKEIRFDERVVKNFHFYDMDFSLAVRRKYKVVVTYKILLAHFSNGTMDSQWAIAANNVTRKWKYMLPAYTKEVNAQEIKKVENATLDYFLHFLIQHNVGWVIKAKYLFKRLANQIFDIKINYYFIKRLFFKGK